MTVVDTIINDLMFLFNVGRRVGLRVFINAVCAGKQCTCTRILNASNTEYSDGFLRKLTWLIT